VTEKIRKNARGAAVLHDLTDLAGACAEDADPGDLHACLRARGRSRASPKIVLPGRRHSGRRHWRPDRWLYDRLNATKINLLSSAAEY
jgi:hypothetical protein